jgi:2-oxoisovalerate ferredoxin oxidoreductase beta subunit
VSTTLRHSRALSLFETFERKDGPQWTTHYCPGCGHGLIHKLIAEAVDDLGMQDRTVLISPVGCAVFAYYYFDVGNIQAAHGRCPAVATAVKRAQPGSLVIGYQGDGDLAAIGGNEILQAANRGENVTIFFVNNAIYGMTGGQLAPTTLLGMHTATTPGGRSAANEGYPLKMCEILATLDAPYYLERVAVGSARHNHRARAAVHKALQYQVDDRGFSLVEILSPCPTAWKMEPVDSARFCVEEMTKVFPLGVLRDGHDRALGHPRLRTRPALEAIPAQIDAIADSAEPELPDHYLSIEEERFKIAGFGGQGVLFLGTLLASAGMLARRQVSWIPSYGPEMRGGTANCSVTLADREIGSPLIEHPTVLVALNGPSLDRFGDEVVPGGKIFYNSSMIDRPPLRANVQAIPVPASEIADGLGSPKVANLVVLGAMLGAGCSVSLEAVLAALPLIVAGRPDLLELDRRALAAGMEITGFAPLEPPGGCRTLLPP